ncbi:MAG: TldD/PmbA family protein [Halanaerobiales bacterium]|nr:TldD/PmbA family protein [Halanaerobiales bacterium]
MKIDNFMNGLLKKAKSNDFVDSEVYLNRSKNFEIRLYKKVIDYYEENEEYGLSFRGLNKDKMGYSYSEKFNQDTIDTLLDNALKNAQIMDEDEEEIYSGSDQYKKIETRTGIFEQDRDKKIELLKDIEKKIYSSDDRIKNINYCIYADEETGEKILNSKGLELDCKNDIAYIYISIIAKEGNDVRTATKYQLFRDLKEVNKDEFVKELVKDAVDQFGAESINSDKYPVILKNEVFVNILSTFSSTLSAENVQKGLSLFKGKLNKKVASNIVTIVDDPFFEDGYRRTYFDSEGVASKYKEVISQGKLQTYLYNLKTAKKDGVESTANGYRSSHKSKISISPTNMYLKKGTNSFNQLKDKFKKVIIIEDVQGLHSGANPVSGDFSLSARGYLAKDGEIVKPVEQITISGNFLKLLNDIVMIGNDFKMGLPGNGHFGSASVAVKSLDVSGG